MRALDAVDFALRAGEIHAIMGENGAGKSTLIKVLTGVLSHDGGEIRLDGKRVRPRSPLHAQQLGISTVYQEINLIPRLSVAENLFLGRQPTRRGRLDWRAMNCGAREALRRLDLQIDLTLPLDSYSIAVQQMVAIARALDISARILILDEPTSSLDQQEVSRLFQVMRRLRDEGLGIVFITHSIDQAYAVADRITVLRNGRLVGEYATAGLSRLELVSRMIGRPVTKSTGSEALPPRDVTAPEPAVVLSARRLGRRNAIKPFDLDIREGEVVGLAGLLGSGRTETARLLFGLDRPDSGELRIKGRLRRLRSPRRAIASRLAMLPENRQTQGLIADLSLRENIILALQARRGWLRSIPLSSQRRLATKYIKVLNIATTDAEKTVKDLSGGNQQKAILARWLATEPMLLILDEPTRGIDVGSKAEIEKLVASLRGSGMAILFISSELAEVIRDSQRVIVLRDRQKVGELAGDDITESRVVNMIAGDGE